MLLFLHRWCLWGWFSREGHLSGQNGIVLLYFNHIKFHGNLTNFTYYKSQEVPHLHVSINLQHQKGKMCSEVEVRETIVILHLKYYLLWYFTVILKGWLLGCRKSEWWCLTSLCVFEPVLFWFGHDFILVLLNIALALLWASQRKA